jgi:hypothetical protein
MVVSSRIVATALAVVGAEAIVGVIVVGRRVAIEAVELMMVVTQAAGLKFVESEVEIAAATTAVGKNTVVPRTRRAETVGVVARHYAAPRMEKVSRMTLNLPLVGENDSNVSETTKA